MTKPQITGQNGNPDLTNFNSARTSVLNEDIRFDSGVSSVSLPLTGADTGNFAISLKGKKRITNIGGIYTGTEVEIKAFRDELELEANKSAQPEKTYSTSDGGTYDVLIMNFTLRRDLTSQEQVTFSIDLLTTQQIL